jgi:hypothetical protein
MTNVVYEDITEDTNDQRNKGNNKRILLHLIYIIYVNSFACIVFKSRTIQQFKTKPSVKYAIVDFEHNEYALISLILLYYSIPQNYVVKSIMIS